MSSYVRETKHPTKDMYIRKYTKRAFYDRAWNNETIMARGHVVDSNGRLLSCPYPKIFNLNEHPSTSIENLVARLDDHPEKIEVRTKYNGHLGILFHDGDDWVNTTSGSFEHDFIEKDRWLIDETISPFIQEMLPTSWTLMFEIIGLHDPHLMTEDHMRHFGGEKAVLLGVNNRETKSAVPMEIWAPAVVSAGVSWSSIATCMSAEVSMNNLGLVDAPDEWALHLFRMKNTEGVVIYDTLDGWYCKVKTDWFVMNRYVFNFAKEKLGKIFVEHGDAPEAFDQMQEELFSRYGAVLELYTAFRSLKIMELQKAVDDIGYVFEGIDTDEDLHLLGLYLKMMMGSDAKSDLQTFERQLRDDFWNQMKPDILHCFKQEPPRQKL
jgi:hypothetical protein